MSVKRVRAFAKINLALRVLGARPDGYHELRTIFQSIALHDTLTFTSIAGPLRIDCTDPTCPTDSSNLVWRAAERLWRIRGRQGAPRDIRVRIVKRIPLRAGLGGGSTDAAAALRALAALWSIDLPRDQMSAIAAELGADVAFPLGGGTVLGLDRGDLLFPLADIPQKWVALVVPRFGVSTAEAFGWFDRAMKSGTDSRPRPAARSVGPGERGASLWNQHGPRVELQNDLQAPVAARHPEIMRLVKSLARAGAAHAAMTGSGSAVFGLFERRASAEAAARALGGGGRRALVTRTLPRASYERLARPWSPPDKGLVALAQPIV